MKPDGTYTVDEILQICNDQLQSWEREELVQKLGTEGLIRSIINEMDADELAYISGYYVSEDAPEEKEVEDFTLHEIINGLAYKLSYMKLNSKQKKSLLDAINNN